jgi:hypothetical protein
MFLIKNKAVKKTPPTTCWENVGKMEILVRVLAQLVTENTVMYTVLEWLSVCGVDGNC